MEDFLENLVAYLNENGVITPLVKSEDTESAREGTYLQLMPDYPKKATCVRCYGVSTVPLGDKQSGVYRIQVSMRNPLHHVVLDDITKLWQFLLRHSGYIIDREDGNYYIFDAMNGPIPLGKDADGNYQYSLNFPVRSRTF